MTNLAARKVGERIRDYREHRPGSHNKGHMTQQELADRLRELPGYPLKTQGNNVAQWERGAHLPPRRTLQYVAQALATKDEPAEVIYGRFLEGVVTVRRRPPDQLDRIERMLKVLLAKVDPDGLKELQRELKEFEVLSGQSDTEAQDDRPDEDMPAQEGE